MRPEDFKDEIARAIQHMVEDIYEKAKLVAYPVGSYYISEDSTSPATLFGGTWVQIDGYALAASSDANLVGTTTGSATHTLTIDEMPAHTHAGPSHTHTATTVSSGGHTHTATTASGGGHTHTATTNSSGAHTHNFSSANGAGMPYGSYDSYRPNASKSVSGYISNAGAHTHTLATNTNGAHTHTLTSSSSGGHTHTVTTAAGGTGDTGSAGGGQTFSIMQPSMYAYIWKRTA